MTTPPPDPLDAIVAQAIQPFWKFDPVTGRTRFHAPEASPVRDAIRAAVLADRAGDERLADLARINRADTEQIARQHRRIAELAAEVEALRAALDGAAGLLELIADEFNELRGQAGPAAERARAALAAAAPAPREG